ncbi:IS66 family transposase [Caenimonas soli]|uniref:IS66 family transposase n=1 Tax=Caenimonas soli TaxID=2735555 RepID=UPI0015551E08|nr:transposase [Caenimonas soli]NPC58488.1 transposase [Caenimonas soli]
MAHFVDHLPYYRLEQINARSMVHPPRSTLASWFGAGDASIVPLYEALRDGCHPAHRTDVSAREPSWGDDGRGRLAHGQHYARPL